MGDLDDAQVDVERAAVSSACLVRNTCNQIAISGIRCCPRKEAERIRQGNLSTPINITHYLRSSTTGARRPTIWLPNWMRLREMLATWPPTCSRHVTTWESLMSKVFRLRPSKMNWPKPWRVLVVRTNHLLKKSRILPINLGEFCLVNPSASCKRESDARH